MLIARLIVSILATFIAACAPAEPQAEPGLPEAGESVAQPEAKEPGPADIELCDAADYRPLIGSNIAVVTLPVDRMLRAFGVNDIVTQEYLPQRTNIVYGTDGVIRRVFCG